MPWPLAWLRRKTAAKDKRPQQTCSGDPREAIRSIQGSAKMMPGVGMIDMECTQKTTLAPSIVVDEYGEQMPSGSINGPYAYERSTVCPKAALVRTNNHLSITELRLGPSKAPCCIILTEDIESYTPPKFCQSSR